MSPNFALLLGSFLTPLSTSLRLSYSLVIDKTISAWIRKTRKSAARFKPYKSPSTVYDNCGNPNVQHHHSLEIEPLGR
ncbi:hypothetical protein GGP41_002710 [Bipolaris sorokiniana]|uniref:Secreted protein n=1 Tax=Cochliobolus sativus TaxID=45130 RepID=A0A8H5ZHB9_COCSA|nr:hypothetical protein GGP41_002710 [Bipolaris sorokiniana]